MNLVAPAMGDFAASLDASSSPGTDTRAWSTLAAGLFRPPEHASGARTAPASLAGDFNDAASVVSVATRPASPIRSETSMSVRSVPSLTTPLRTPFPSELSAAPGMPGGAVAMLRQIAELKWHR